MLTIHLQFKQPIWSHQMTTHRPWGQVRAMLSRISSGEWVNSQVDCRRGWRTTKSKWICPGDVKTSRYLLTTVRFATKWRTMLFKLTVPLNILFSWKSICMNRNHLKMLMQKNVLRQQKVMVIKKSQHQWKVMIIKKSHRQ